MLLQEVQLQNQNKTHNFDIRLWKPLQVFTFSTFVYLKTSSFQILLSRVFGTAASFPIHNCREFENLKRLPRHEFQTIGEPKVVKHSPVENLKTLGLPIHDCFQLENILFSNTRLSRI